MTPAFRLALLWIVGATIMVMFGLMLNNTSYFNGEYIPANGDAFYHARRILDVVLTGQPLLQFDPKIHVPEGSWITWPWAYDWSMAQITKLFGPFAGVADANRVLMRIPVAASLVYIGVVLLLARQLGFSFALTALQVTVVAALPVVYLGFAVGNIDHHFAEGMWTAFTICAGIWFFSSRDSLMPAVVLGLVLATAVGVHNSLFILQIPVALTFLLRWLRGEPLPARRACVAFAISLAALTLAVSAPSQPLRQGFFEFYTLSWFHVYIAACTAAFCTALGYLPRRTPTVWLVFVAAALAAVPIVNILGFAREYMSGELESIRDIVEASSPYQLQEQTRDYSWLLWLTAPMVAFNAWLVWKTRDSRIQFFAVAAAFGLVLLQLQFRFHVFGALAMVATPVLALHLAQERWPAHANRIVAAGCIAFLVVMIPTRRNITTNWTLGGHESYRYVAGAFPVLKKACVANPGIVLSKIDAGHWVRYHSDCSVIGNVFLLTPQHASKALETRALLGLKPEELLAAEQPVRYVLVYHRLGLGPHEPDLEEWRLRMRPLESGLLGPLDRLPPQYRLLWSFTTPKGQTYARLFEIVR